MTEDSSATTDALLSIRRVTKSFSGLTALSDVTFDVHTGQIKGVIGPNGAGKTTLFNVIAGTFPPSAGEVLLRGQDVTGLPSHRIARAGIARTFQLMKPFGTMTVHENVVIAALLTGISIPIYGHILNTRVYDQSIGILPFIVLAIFLSVFSQFGDLFASAIKRYAGIKDFGKLMPGHGGAIDRLDSVLFTSGITFVFILIFF